MLTREWMGVLALGILWVNTLLVCGAALQRFGALLALSKRIASTVRRGVSSGAVASVTVEQIGRYGAGALRNIVWHDRAYSSEIRGGQVSVGEGESIELPSTTRAMVWVDASAQRAAAGMKSEAAFDEAYVSARKAKGFARRVTTTVADGSEVFVAKATDDDGERWLVSTFDPNAWCRARALVIALGFVPAVLAIAAGITVVALWPPAFGTVSIVGASIGVLYFLLVLPAGTAIRDWARLPHERILRGTWADPARRPTPVSSSDASSRGKAAAASAAMLVALAVTTTARAEETPKPYPGKTRFRGSIGGALGGFVSPDTRPRYYQAISLIHAQAGWQFNDLVAMYAMGTVGFGGGEEASMYGGLSWMVDVTFEDRTFFGFGLDNFFVASLEGNGRTTGFSPGARLRLGGYPLTFGHRDTTNPRRRGLAVGAELGIHPFPQQPMLSPALFVAYEVY